MEHYLLFSDMPADVRRRWDARRGVIEVKRPSNKCNGMTYDAELNLIVCEHATSSLIRERPDGRREVLASHFEGQELNSPNDVCVHSSGAIYFSDPWYGRMPVYGVERPRQLGFQGVYRVPPGGGAPKLLVDRYLFDQPNGLCFSPDERRLYVNDTVQALIRVFDVEADGSLVERARVRDRHPLGAGARRARRHEMRPAGQCLGARRPAASGSMRRRATCSASCACPKLVANLAWGGPDFRTLYLTATHSVYAVPTKVGPRHEPYMTARGGGVGARAARRPSARASLDLTGRHAARSARAARMIIQDMQNDVIMEGGAFADSGAPAHAQAAARGRERRAGSRRRRGRAASSSSMSGSSSSPARRA